MDIVKFDKNIKNSYFFDKNFNGRLSVSTIDENMISVEYLKEFHYQVSLILHLYSSLYIKLKKKEVDFGYNVNKFSDLVNNLNIRISDDNSKDKILGEFVEERTFIFIIRRLRDINRMLRRCMRKVIMIILFLDILIISNVR